MKALLYLLACIGALVMTLSLASAVGIGHFRLYHGLTPLECHAAGYSA